MKTTIDIADDLLRRAKAAAIQRKTTLRALMEEGLRKVLEQRRPNAAPRRITIRSVDGNGLTKEAREMSWQEIIDLSNERPRDWD